MSDTLLRRERATSSEPLHGQLLAHNPQRLQRSAYPHFCSLPIRWSDVENGVVSRIGMAQFYEDARTHVMRAILGDENFGFDKWKAVLRAITIEHLGTARPDLPITMAGTLAEVGRSSYAFALAAFQGERCVSLGRAIGVTVNDEMRPAPTPPELRLLLQSHVWPHADVIPASRGDADLPKQDNAYPFVKDYPTRFSDTDAVGHVNNVAVTRYHDNGLMAFQAEMTGRVTMHGDAGYWRVARHEISMLGESFYPAPMRVCIGVTGEIGATHFTLAQVLFQEGRCTGQAVAEISVMDASGKPRALPTVLRDRLERARILPATR
jgi:acyl-CoA thioester hydrolase